MRGPGGAAFASGRCRCGGCDPGRTLRATSLVESGKYSFLCRKEFADFRPILMLNGCDINES